MPACVQEIVIDRPLGEVAAYAAQVPNLPKWTGFFQSVGTEVDGRYPAMTPLGPVTTWIEPSYDGERLIFAVVSVVKEKEKAYIELESRGDAAVLKFVVELPEHAPAAAVARQEAAMAGELRELKRLIEETWEYEHTVDADVPREAVWRRYAEPSAWPAWDEGLAEVVLDGGFREGAEGRLTPRGRGPVPFRVTLLREGTSYTDEASIGPMRVRFSHVLADLPGGGTRITHRVELCGAGGAEIGPGVVKDIPDSIANLVRLARADLG